jgi:starvation-inducible DNA-binding protein
MQEILQKLAFSCLDLGLLVKQCHWNARGVGFKPLHDFLDIVFDQLIDVSDDLSERMATLDFPASGDVVEIAKGSAVEAIEVEFIKPQAVVKQLTTRLKQVVKLFYTSIEEISLTGKDPVTENMLQDMTQKLDKLLWMLRSQAEAPEEAVSPALAQRVTDV